MSSSRHLWNKLENVLCIVDCEDAPTLLSQSRGAGWPPPIPHSSCFSCHECTKRTQTAQSTSPRWDSQSTYPMSHTRNSHYYLLLPLGTGRGMLKLRNVEELTAQIQVPPRGRPPQQQAVHFGSGNLPHQPQTNHSASLN